MKTTVILATLLAVMALPLQASTIRKACMSASRAGSPAMCHCIQAAADRTLSKRDQKLAAKFFRDPDRAQEIRMSDRRSHEKFWDRYKSFSQTAEAFCS